MNNLNSSYTSKYSDAINRPYIPLKEEDSQTFNRLMHEYYNNYCIPCSYSFKTIMEFINQGARLVANLQNRLDPEGKKLTPCTDQEALLIVWFLTAQHVAIGEGFYDGMRLIPGRDLFDFLSTHPNCYSRISTHYTETSNRFLHHGLDLRDMGLPAHKHAILFGVRKNHTTFIKLEDHGCPPFWKRGFKSLKNFKEYIGHTFDYLNSRPLSITILRIMSFIKAQVHKFFQTRHPAAPHSKPLYQRVHRVEERIDRRVANAFKKAIHSLVHINNACKQALIKEGLSLGLEKIHDILFEIQRVHRFNKNIDSKGVFKNPQDEHHLNRVLDDPIHLHGLSLNQIIQKDRERGVHGRKNYEVILPLYQA